MMSELKTETNPMHNDGPTGTTEGSTDTTEGPTGTTEGPTGTIEGSTGPTGTIENTTGPTGTIEDITMNPMHNKEKCGINGNTSNCIDYNTDMSLGMYMELFKDFYAYSLGTKYSIPRLNISTNETNDVQAQYIEKLFFDNSNNIVFEEENKYYYTTQFLKDITAGKYIAINNDGLQNPPPSEGYRLSYKNIDDQFLKDVKRSNVTINSFNLSESIKCFENPNNCTDINNNDNSYAKFVERVEDIFTKEEEGEQTKRVPIAYNNKKNFANAVNKKLMQMNTTGPNFDVIYEYYTNNKKDDAKIMLYSDNYLNKNNIKNDSLMAMIKSCMQQSITSEMPFLNFYFFWKNYNHMSDSLISQAAVPNSFDENTITRLSNILPKNVYTNGTDIYGIFAQAVLNNNNISIAVHTLSNIKSVYLDEYIVIILNKMEIDFKNNIFKISLKPLIWYNKNFYLFNNLLSVIQTNKYKPSQDILNNIYNEYSYFVNKQICTEYPDTIHALMYFYFAALFKPTRIKKFYKLVQTANISLGEFRDKYFKKNQSNVNINDVTNPLQPQTGGDINDLINEQIIDENEDKDEFSQSGGDLSSNFDEISQEYYEKEINELNNIIYKNYNSDTLSKTLLTKIGKIKGNLITTPTLESLKKEIVYDDIDVNVFYPEEKEKKVMNPLQQQTSTTTESPLTTIQSSTTTESPLTTIQSSTTPTKSSTSTPTQQSVAMRDAATVGSVALGAAALAVGLGVGLPTGGSKKKKQKRVKRTQRKLNKTQRRKKLSNRKLKRRKSKTYKKK
jgi:hypothetical protein